jgi:hypothetical protein
MEEPGPEFDQQKSVAMMVAALNELRDALVNASLALRDLQFDADLETRNAAAKLSDEVLNRLKGQG